MTTAPAGAGPFNVKVPVTDCPPGTVIAERPICDTDGGLMVSDAVAGDPEAEIVTDVDNATGIVDAVNVPVSAPEGTVHVESTASAELLFSGTM